MLFINDKPLDLSVTTDPRVIKVKEAFQRIKERGFPYVFRDGHGIQINPTGAKEPGKRYAFNLVAEVANSDTGREYWRYSKTPPRVSNKGELIYKSKRFVFNDVLILNEKDIDFIYYLLYLSDAIKTGKIKLVDKKADAANQVAAKKKMISTRFYLYDETSDFYEAEELLRTIALSFGVSKADDKQLYSLDQVKLELERVIEAAEMNKDRERDERAFKYALDESGLVKMKATVQQAIDKNLVRFDEPHWILLNEKGNKDRTMCTVPSTEYNRRYELLVECLQRNVNLRDAVEQRLNKEGAFMQPKDLTPEMIEDFNIGQLKSYASKYGMQGTFTKKADELKAFLLAKIAE